MSQWIVNSTTFVEVCSEPSFQVAYGQYGPRNFFTGYSGSTKDPKVDTDYYGFEWTGACHNSTWTGLQCSEQEYWEVNLTTGGITGPIFQEGIPSCGCPAALVVSSPAGLLFLGVIATVGAGLLLIGLRRRRRPSQPNGPTAAGSPPCGPSA